MPYKSNFKKVGDFHRTFKIDEQGHSLRDVLALRDELIREEVAEAKAEFDDIAINFDGSPNYEKLLKELVDILYVVYGTGVSLNLDIDAAFDEVHKSNMSKLDDDGKPVFREDGKAMKTKNYKPADLKKIIKG